MFLMPRLLAQAERRYASGPIDYTVAWLLLVFLGLFGIHRFYLGKWITGLIWLVTGGLFGIGWLYDLWTMNEQVSEINQRG
jgi:TM2 domain-containing membrane protein YozV